MVIFKYIEVFYTEVYNVFNKIFLVISIKFKIVLC